MVAPAERNVKYTRGYAGKQDYFLSVVEAAHSRG